MNDRFKFRVWNKPGNSYISAKDDADFVYLEEEGNITVGLYNGDEEDMLYLKEEDLIVEQCTGLKDKNGNLIYEGDILKDDNNCIWRCVFQMNNGYSINSLGFMLINEFGHAQPFINVEVIGNIHENPELLEDK